MNLPQPKKKGVGENIFFPRGPLWTLTVRKNNNNNSGKNLSHSQTQTHKGHK